MNLRLNEIEKKIVAILLAYNAPVSISFLEKTLEAKKREIKQTLKELERKFIELNLPLRIVEVEGEYEISIDEETGFFLSTAMNSHKGIKALSKAALETLAVIAVNQPVTRKEIMRIRGVAPDSSIATLLEHELIDKIEKDGKAYYVTTNEFLRAAGLKTLKEFKKEVERLRNGSEE